MAEKKEKAAPAAKRLKVRATQDGFYDNKLRRTGDVFHLDVSQKHPDVYPKGHKDAGKPHPKAGEPVLFSDKWMEIAPPDAPLKQTSSGDVLRQEHDDTMAARAASKAAGTEPSTDAATGDGDPLGGNQ